MVRDGVLMFFATLMTSVRRGTPRVTFLPLTPAKWKVFSVICVAGCPMDCAASVPIISPGYATVCRNLVSISPSTQSKASCVRRYSRSTRFECSVDRSMWKKVNVALRCASTLSGCSPSTTTSFFVSSCTFSITCSGLSPLQASLLFQMPNIICAFQMRRVRLTGRNTESSPLGISAVRIRLSSSFRVSYSESMSCLASKLVRSSSSISCSSQSGFQRGLSKSYSYLFFRSSSFIFSAGSVWLSMPCPSIPSSPYRNWMTSPTLFRTVPSYLMITSSMDFTSRRWM
mmetsp:Transcript_18897/g.48506  ORF Transcript_18897/g.48506 Transcript_18897/m.48506 type:complete len:286 (+) Transcript_18897:875-1732(+)